MKSIIFSCLFTLTIGLFFIQCNSAPQNDGEEETTEQEQSSGTNETDIEEKKQEILDKMAEGKATDKLVNYQDLKSMMPEKIAGLKRVDLSGQSMDMMGMKLSMAEAEYKDDKGKSIDITLNDAGGIPQATAALASWTNLNMDRAGDDGFERVATYNGHKSFEKYEKASNRSEFAVFVANRFIFVMKGKGVSVDDLKKAFDDMKVESLIKKG